MTELTEEFKHKQLETLREELQKEGSWDKAKHDDFTLHRFLNPKAYNVSEAKLAWTQWLLWRKEWGVDTILETDVIDEKQHHRFLEVYPHGLHGVDLKGQPVLIYRLGKTKFSPLLSEFTEVLRQKMHAQLYEFIMRVALPACSLAAGKRVDRVTTIYDLDGITMMSTSSCASVLTSTTKILGLYYPETLSHLLIINAPSMFDSVFYASKGMLSPATQKKIQVFGKAATKAELTKLISADQLPKFLGGTSADELGDGFGPWTDFETASPEGRSASKAMAAAAVAAAAEKAAGGPTKVTDIADIAVAVEDKKLKVAATFKRLASGRGTAAEPAVTREDIIETFYSCIDKDFDFNQLGISSAESRFLNQYSRASKRYSAPSFAGARGVADEPDACEVEAIPEEEGGSTNRLQAATQPNSTTPAVEKVSAMEKAGKCCAVM